MAAATPKEPTRLEQQGAVDLSRRLFVPAAPASPTRGVGICVVGTKWGAEHWRWIRAASPSAQLFVCGRDEARTKQAAASACAVDFFVGLEQAVQDDRVEALSLALPHHIHREAVETCLAANKHVLVEKPIATNLADADAMIEAARHANKILMVAEMQDFLASVTEGRSPQTVPEDARRDLEIVTHGYQSLQTQQVSPIPSL